MPRPPRMICRRRGRPVRFRDHRAAGRGPDARPAPARRTRSPSSRYSLPVIDEIGGWEAPHLVCLGGLYLPDYRAFVGPQTVAGLRELTADIIFLGCDGLTVEAGLTTPHVLVAEVGAMMAARAPTGGGRRGLLQAGPARLHADRRRSRRSMCSSPTTARRPGARRAHPRGRRGGDPRVTRAGVARGLEPGRGIPRARPGERARSASRWCRELGGHVAGAGRHGGRPRTCSGATRG